jgi:hypothetical protein
LAALEEEVNIFPQTGFEGELIITEIYCESDENGGVAALETAEEVQPGQA